MKKIDLEDVAPETVGTDSERRPLSEPLETEHLACNHYKIAPGEGLPGGLHAHMDQEELFVVRSGEATFETLSGEVVVSAGEIIRFPAGEFQSGRNSSDEDLVVLALGVPRATEDVRIPVSCPDCGFEVLRLDFDGAISFVCPNCEVAHTPADCPDCGHSELQMRSTETNGTVAVCQRCESTFENPPLR